MPPTTSASSTSPSSSSSSSSSSLPSAAPSSSTTSAQPTHVQKPQIPPPLSPIAPLPLRPNLDLDAAALCRVCRSDDPSLGQLFHPCRCTGSIAHVHQDCLSTWLSHSKKSSCELCGHLFSFEKVYKAGSPARPPLTTITFQALLELLRFFLLFSRAILVGLCWLGFVPWSVVWVSTAYWKAADWFALGITSNRDQVSRSSKLSSDSSLLSPSEANSTNSSNPLILDSKLSSSINSTLSTWVTNVLPSLDLDPNSIALDIFQGQLITCAIILSFVVIFLLREWILQNTPPPDLIREGENAQPRIHWHVRLVEDPPIPPGANRRIPIFPIDPETLDWSHATHFLFSDTPSQLAPSDLPTPADSTQLTVSTREPSDDQIIGTKHVGNFEKIPSFLSSPTSTEQPTTTRGLLEPADPGLSIPSYKAHDLIDCDTFSHRVLATSVFLLFVAENLDSRPILFGTPPSPHLDDLNEHQKQLMNAWGHLAELTSHPSNGFSDSVRQLRNFILNPNSEDDQSTATLPYQEIELNWTRAVLSDPKISKHIQYLFNHRSSTQVGQTRDEIRQKGLIYSLLSVYISTQNQNVMGHENSSSKDAFGPLVPSNCFERIYNELRLFVLPLLDRPANGEHHSAREQQQPNELGEEIYQMIQKHDSTPNISSNRINHPFGVSSVSLLQETILKILVKQRLLSKLINSPAFVRYSRGMVFDNNSFTNRRLNSRGKYSPKCLHSQNGRSVVSDPQNDLSEITIQLINYKASTISASVEPCSLFRPPACPNSETSADWIDYSTFEHKLLVTSFYLLFSNKESVADLLVPVLQTSSFNGLLEHSNDQENCSEFSSILGAWSKLIKGCTAKSSSELLQQFKNFSPRTSPVSTEGSRVHGFQKLETEWLSKLLNDPSIAQFLVSILSTRKNETPNKYHQHSSRMIKERGDNQPLNFFLVKLVYVYIVLETIIPSKSAETMITITRRQHDFIAMILQSGWKLLEDHLNILEEQSVEQEELGHDYHQTRNKDTISEMISETRFLLDACRPSPASAITVKATSSNLLLNPTRADHNPQGDLRYELHIGKKLKRGIIEILARQNVLNMIAMDRKFSKYARTMLFEPDLFSRIPSLSSILQLDDDDEHQASQSDEQKLDCTKGKQKDLIAKKISFKGDHPTMHIHSPDSSQSSANQAESFTHNPTLDQPSLVDTSSNRTDFKRPSFQKQTQLRPVESVSDPDLNASNDPASRQQLVSARPPPIALPQERENNLEAVPNLEIDRVGVQVAEQPPVGHLHGFIPQRAQRDVVLAAGIGAGLADAFAFDDPVANGGDDELMVEDIDGILELIGMKGSLFMLAQNVGLMTMLLSLSLLAFVHLPHMMGKIAILVKAHRLLAPPLKGLLILQRYVHRMLDWLSDYIKVQIQNYHLPSKLEKTLSLVGGSDQSISGCSQWLDRWPVTEFLRTTRHFANQTRSIISESLPLNVIWVKFVQQVSDRMNSIAYGSKPLDRALAILIGYFELILMSVLYLSSGLDQQRAKFVSETLVNGLQQQLLIGKVGIFIFVELVIFPFLCGLLLNFTTIPIFANATLSNRLELYSSSPYSATLITWLVGTCFMFSFAVLVSTCRESLRAGVCWWIRDPSDDRFNPIREILERSAWSQVKKISVSAVMYGAVIICGLGSIVFNLVFFTGVLPLRIHADRSISSSALDLVIYQNLLPLFLECFKPRTKLKECLQGISRCVARQLRLTCYLYGERRIAEETTLEVVERGPDGEVRPLERRAKVLPLAFFNFSHRGSSNLTINEARGDSSRIAQGSLGQRRKWAGGSFARVPATDSVKVVRGRKMHIPVYVDGTPIDPADMAIIEQQQAEAREEGRGTGPNQYTIVYLPPQFQARMILYVISMWSAAVTVIWTMIGIPLLIGRILLDNFFLSEQDEPHDVYAYAIGILCCAVTFTIGMKLWGKYSEYYHNNLVTGSDKSAPSELEGEQNHPEGIDEAVDLERMANNHQSIFRNINWMIKKFFHFVVLTLGGVLLPILTCILLDLYVMGIVKPKQISSGDAESLPEIYLLEAWNYGAICLSIGARVIKLSLPEHPISIAQDQIMVHWRAGNLSRVVEDINLKLIIPIFYKFSLMILVPFLIVQPLIMLIFNHRNNYGFGVYGQQEGTRKVGWIFKNLKLISNWSALWNGSININFNLTDQLNNRDLEDSNHTSNSNSTNTTTTNHRGYQMKLIELNYLILKLIYPLILSWFSQFYLVKISYKIFSGWLEKIRDERFLERRRLKNYEPASPLSRNDNANVESD